MLLLLYVIAITFCKMNKSKKYKFSNPNKINVLLKSPAVVCLHNKTQEEIGAATFEVIICGAHLSYQIVCWSESNSSLTFINTESFQRNLTFTALSTMALDLTMPHHCRGHIFSSPFPLGEGFREKWRLRRSRSHLSNQCSGLQWHWRPHTTGGEA